MKKNIILAAAVAAAHLAAAQNHEPFSYNTEISPSVETYKITKYGNVTPSLYTGAMAYSIPLHTYKDEDFEIPISLEYRFDGYRPAVHSGTIGYGWALQYGGVITREVKGYPDELSGDDCEDKFEGYYETISDGIFSLLNNTYQLASGTIAGAMLYGESADYRSSINVFADSPIYRHVTTHGEFSTKQYDANPDLFSFNFLGYSGNFMMRPDGSMEVFNCSCPKGEISIEYDFTKREGLPEPEIIITTGDGYRYTFGGDYTALEYSIPSTPDSHVTVSGWRLRKIEAPNGSWVDFIHNPLLAHDLRVVSAYTPVIAPELSESFYKYSTPYEVNTTINDFYPVPQRINVNGNTIFDFTMTEHNYDENEHDCFTEKSNVVSTAAYGPYISSFPRSLESIVIKNNDEELIDKYDFNHSFKHAAGIPRMLLSAISGNCGRYIFEYENLTPTYNDTRATDHWGFWNGKPYLLSLPSVLNYDFDNLYSQFITGNTSKESVFSYTKQGALKKITYPTGGYTTIQYEANTARKMIDRRFGAYPDLCEHTDFPDMEIGGVRVKSIANTADGVTRTMTYEYNLAGNSSSSSGILLKMPLYSLTLHYIMKVADLPDGEVRMTSRAFTDECGTNLPSDPFIAYSRVTEHYPDGSYIEYIFEDYENKPDWYDYSLDISCSRKKVFRYEQDVIKCDDGDSSYPISIKKTLLPQYKDFSNCRGKMLSKSEFDSDGILKKKTSYTYSDVLECQRQMFYNTIIDFTEMPLEIYSSRLTNEVESTYDGNKCIATSTFYGYNENGQIAYVGHDSDSVTTYLHYKYMLEEEETLDNAALRAAITDVVQTKNTMGNTYIISNTHYQYESGGNSKPVRILRYEGEVPAICDNVQNVYGIPEGFKMKYYTFTYDPNKFRLLESTYPGGAYISYTWDTYSRHILTKTVNHSSNTHLYEWKDLVGPVKITMPTTQFRTFEYDSKNRLSLEKDSDGASIKAYKYHLNNE